MARARTVWQRAVSVGACCAFVLFGAVACQGTSLNWDADGDDARAEDNRYFQDRPMLGALPPDLPDNPEPCVSYCKESVAPTYRMVPKLVQVEPERIRTVSETVMEMRAREVLVKPTTNKAYEKCGTRCEQEMVQVKPGGFRWVHDQECDCWQYCDAPPEYKWCNKVTEEEGIRYCVEQPAEYKTVVDTVPRQARAHGVRAAALRRQVREGTVQPRSRRVGAALHGQVCQGSPPFRTRHARRCP